MVPCKNQIAQFQKNLGSKHPRSCFHLPIGFGRFASRAAQSTVGSPLPSWRFDQSNGKWNADIIWLNICSYQTVLLIYRLKVNIASRVDMGKVTQNQAPIRLHLGNLFHLFQCDSGPRDAMWSIASTSRWSGRHHPFASGWSSSPSFGAWWQTWIASVLQRHQLPVCLRKG